MILPTRRFQRAICPFDTDRTVFRDFTRALNWMFNPSRLAGVLNWMFSRIDTRLSLSAIHTTFRKLSVPVTVLC